MTRLFAPLMAQWVENPPAMQDTRDEGLIPGSGRFPGEGNGNLLQYSCHRNPRTEEPGGLPSIGLQRVRHDLANKQQQQTTSTEDYNKLESDMSQSENF